MKKFKFATIAMCFAMLISSCGTAQKNGTLIGAGGGAALGALAGRLIGGNAKGTVIGAAVGTAVGATAGNLIGRHMDKVKAKAAAALQNANVDTITDENGLTGVRVTFDGGILFATGKADLTPSAKAELTKFAQILKENDDCSVVIQGHTDSTGSDAVNNPLSVNRASSVSKYLTGQGVASSQIKATEGYGSTKPVADNGTVEGRNKNRRVEVYLFASEKMIEAAKAGTLK